MAATWIFPGHFTQLGTFLGRKKKDYFIRWSKPPGHELNKKSAMDKISTATELACKQISSTRQKLKRLLTNTVRYSWKPRQNLSNIYTV